MSAELNLKALPTEAYAVARVAHTVAKSLIALRPALSLCSTLVSLLLPLVRRCHPLWRFTARWYVAGFDRLAAWHALQACRSAIEGGIDTRKSENRAFFGPYASVSVGLGD